jgi:hypothetical protein
MKNTIYLKEKTLGKHHLEDCISSNARNNLSSERGNGQALLSLSYSPNYLVLNSGDTHHMASSDRFFSYLESCSRPLIFMGDDYIVEVFSRGRFDLDNGLFQNVLHSQNISVNLLSIYQITHSGLGKKVEFTPDSVIIFYLSDG